MERVLEIKIPQADKNYEIAINNEPIEALYKELLQKTQGRKRLIVFSEKVFKLYSKNLPFPKHEIFVLKDGENQKNYKNYLKIVNRLMVNKLSRNDVLISIGGGVVGDLVGYVAATYMRGISFIQIPTTLLAMVDSSVGGKTAIDLPDAKNILGAFYQPESVFINLNFLKTLDYKQYMSGLGEILKYAFIEQNCCPEDPQHLFEFLTVNASRIKEKDLYFLERLISICLLYKINIVKSDEKENGLRKVLNLGHTYGHALETITNYRKYTHGQAVVWGMMLVFQWALKNCYIDTAYYNSARELMAIYGFTPFDDKVDCKKLVKLMQLDKKADGERIKLIVPVAPRLVAEKDVSNLAEFQAWLSGV